MICAVVPQNGLAVTIRFGNRWHMVLSYYVPESAIYSGNRGITRTPAYTYTHTHTHALAYKCLCIYVCTPRYFLRLHPFCSWRIKSPRRWRHDTARRRRCRAFLYSLRLGFFSFLLFFPLVCPSSTTRPVSRASPFTRARRKSAVISAVSGLHCGAPCVCVCLACATHACTTGPMELIYDRGGAFLSCSSATETFRPCHVLFLLFFPTLFSSVLFSSFFCSYSYRASVQSTDACCVCPPTSWLSAIYYFARRVPSVWKYHCVQMKLNSKTFIMACCAHAPYNTRRTERQPTGHRGIVYISYNQTRIAGI